MNDSTTLCLNYGTWGEHPDFPSSDWRHEVAEKETRLGYWEWVEVQIEIYGDSDD